MTNIFQSSLLEDIRRVLDGHEDSLFEVYDLDDDMLMEDFKTLPGHVKKIIATKYLGGERSDVISHHQANGVSHFNDHLNHVMDNVPGVSVIHKNGKPIAAIHHAGGSERKFDTHTHEKSGTQQGLRKGKAIERIHSILAKHSDSGSHKDKNLYKNHNIEIKTYGEDWHRDLKRVKRKNIKRAPKGNKDLDKIKDNALEKHVSKRMPNPHLEKVKAAHAELAKHIAAGDHDKIVNHTNLLNIHANDLRNHEANNHDKEDYKRALHGIRHGNEWDKQYSKHVINDLKMKGVVKEEHIMEGLEPRQHIIQQLQRAKISMNGGAMVRFMNESTKYFVSGTDASILIDKYSQMKPLEKEEFQYRIGYSYRDLKEELKGE